MRSKNTVLLVFVIGCSLTGIFSANSADAAADISAPFAVSRPASVDWHAIESDDYRTYIKNLQSIGCPTQTVRDIVTADVVAAFAPRRNTAIKARYQNFQYWKSDPGVTEAREAMQSQRREVDAEMNRVLQQLLGTNASLPSTGREWKRLELEHQLQFLSPVKREQTIAILSNNSKVNQDMEKLAGALNLTESTNELHEILADYAREKADLKQILSPEEFQLVQMTTSWTSENLRRAMVHFQPTEAEFHVIFEAWQPHDENLAQSYAARETDPGNDAVFATIKERLTPSRYQQYRDTWWK